MHHATAEGGGARLSKPTIGALREATGVYVPPVSRINVSPWLVATEATRAHLPAASGCQPLATIDPTRVAGEAFLGCLLRLDEHLYGPRGLSLPRWAFYDCAEMTGVIVGHAVRADALTPDVREIFGEPEDDALVPLSMLVAVPTLEAGHWIAYSLACLDGSGLPDTCERTLALGLSILAPRSVTVVTQWTSERLPLHLAFGSLEVLAAWLPMHDEPASGAFRYTLGSGCALEPDRSIELSDVASLVALQRGLEEGGRAWITGAPQRSFAPLRFDAGSPPPPPSPEPRDRGPLRDEVARVEHLRPYVVATPAHLAKLDLAPFGRAIDPAHRFDPLRTRSARFMARLERLDRVAFSADGMAMPRWLFFDGAELPGAIVGLGISADALDDEQRDFLEVEPDEEHELVPLAMYIAIPSLEPGAWYGHNLASIGRRLPGAPLRGLGSNTKAVGLAVLRCHTQLASTQWDSPTLHVHVRLGMLELITAWTPANTEPSTLTYRVRVDDEALRRLASGTAPETCDPERWMRRDDHGAMRELQARLEAGERWAIVGRPGVDGVPIARWPG